MARAPAIANGRAFVELQRGEIYEIHVSNDAPHEAAVSVKSCANCGNLDSEDPCAICRDPKRDPAIICVVAEVGDLWAPMLKSKRSLKKAIERLRQLPSK